MYLKELSKNSPLILGYGEPEIDRDRRSRWEDQDMARKYYSRR